MNSIRPEGLETTRSGVVRHLTIPAVHTGTTGPGGDMRHSSMASEAACEHDFRWKRAAYEAPLQRNIIADKGNTGSRSDNEERRLRTDTEQRSSAVANRTTTGPLGAVGAIACGRCGDERDIGNKHGGALVHGQLYCCAMLKARGEGTARERCMKVEVKVTA
jgi:hypothetical protein